MKLSVLLVTLLVLSWTSAEDVGDKEISQQHNDGNKPEPQPRNKASQNTEEVESEIGQETPTVRVARSFPTNGNSKLQWSLWSGKLPAGAVSIWNDHWSRTDYVCRVGCTPGYYTPKKGAYCYYIQGHEEIKGKDFYILVNKDNFEILEWKEYRYWKKLPENSVEACDNYYVAKSSYGLGKVRPYMRLSTMSHYTSKLHYYVLTVNMDIMQQKITNVEYNMKGVRVVKDKPETLRRSTIYNYQCRKVMKMVPLEKSIETEQRWDISGAVTLGVSTSVSAGIPNIVDLGLAVSVKTSLTMAYGTSKVESNIHTVVVTADIHPNYYCTVTMEGIRYLANIPFTALLTRTYHSGKTTSTTVSGIYKKIQMGEIVTEAHRCKNIPNAKRC